MKRLLRGVIGLLVVGALPLACAATKTSPEAFCSKGTECKRLKEGVTEQSCVTDASGNLADLRKPPACAALANATEESLLCVGDLSCEELDVFLADQTGTHKCNQPFKDLSVGMVADCNAASGQ